MKYWQLEKSVEPGLEEGPGPSEVVAVVKVVVMLNTAAYLNSKNNKESTQK